MNGRAQIFGGGGYALAESGFLWKKKRLWKRINRLTALTVAVAVAFMALAFCCNIY